MPTINEFLGTSNYLSEADGERFISTPTERGRELTTSGFEEDPYAVINATGGTTFEVVGYGGAYAFGPNVRKDGLYGSDYFPSGCSATLDGVDESTSAGWVVSTIGMDDMFVVDSYVKFTFGPFNIELHVTIGDTGRVYTLTFTWPGGSYTRDVPPDNYGSGYIVIAMNGSKVGFWAETLNTLRFLAEYDFVTVPKNYVYSDFEMYSPDSGDGRTEITYQRQYWGGDPPPEPVVAGGIRPLRKFQTLTGSPGGGRPLRKFQNGGHSGGRPLRKFATGI